MLRILAFFFLVAAAPVQAAQHLIPANRLFSQVAAPSMATSAAYGSYSKGCLAGAAQLPQSGPTWQAMRLSRNRSWAHPETLRFIERLSREAVRAGWKGLYIGDISQPRGGPMPGGHISHQIGLDMDIWLLPAMDMNLSRAAREKLSSKSVRAANRREVNGNWTEAHYRILRAAARDRAVNRIFVTAPIKLKMCADAPANDRKWLRKIRPWWGHTSHFHVRLDCPNGDRNCTTQAAIPPGDGCDQLDWWLTEALEPARPSLSTRPSNAPVRRPKMPLVLSDLPRQCTAVLRSQ